MFKIMSMAIAIMERIRMTEKITIVVEQIIIQQACIRQQIHIYV